MKYINSIWWDTGKKKKGLFFLEPHNPHIQICRFLLCGPFHALVKYTYALERKRKVIQYFWTSPNFGARLIILFIYEPKFLFELFYTVSPLQTPMINMFMLAIACQPYLCKFRLNIHVINHWQNTSRFGRWKSDSRPSYLTRNLQAPSLALQWCCSEKPLFCLLFCIPLLSLLSSGTRKSSSFQGARKHSYNWSGSVCCHPHFTKPACNKSILGDTSS